MFGRQSRYQRLIGSADFKELSPSHKYEVLQLEATAFQIELESEVRLREQEQLSKARMAKMKQELRIQARELRVKAIEVYFRTVLTLLLVIILATAIFVGIIKGVPAGNLTQYLTPISGLVGIAIGYLFGRGAEGRAADHSNTTGDTSEARKMGSAEEDGSVWEAGLR